MLREVVADLNIASANELGESMNVLGKISVVVLISFVPMADSKPLAGPATILSEGMSQCGEFVRQPELVTARTEWVLGYLSGANSQDNGQRRLIGRTFDQPAAIKAWLSNYCSSRALDYLASAAENLRTELAHREGINY